MPATASPGRMTPEFAAWGAFSTALGFYFGTGAHVVQNGSSIDIVVEDIPIFGRRNRMDVTFRLPAGSLDANRSGVALRAPLQGDSVRYLLSDGTAFPHPHIWDNGKPCWNGQSMSRLPALFENIANTLTWTNVTEDSYRIGHFTICQCTTALSEGGGNQIASHKAKVRKTLKLPQSSPSEYYTTHINTLLDNALRCFR